MVDRMVVERAPAPAGRTPREASARRSPNRSRVRVPELALGILLVFGFGLAAVLWHTSTSNAQPVVVLQRDLPKGSVVTEADVAAVPVRAEGQVLLVPWAARDRVVGRVLQADLTAGSPLSPTLVADTTPLTAGEALVGLKLPTGAHPHGLAVDDVVDAVAIADPVAGADPLAPVPTVATGAVVWSVTELADAEASTVVTVRLPADAARRLGAVAGAVRLVRIGS